MSGRHPLAHGCPPRWASSWGQDKFGVFAGFVVDRVEYRMRWIAEGKFQMGSPSDEEGRGEDEGPQHQVIIRRGFWLGETPVTQRLWEAVMGEDPSHFKGPDRPVEQVSWDDCQRFCAALEGLAPGLGVRLPREAEWEYACRAGTQSPTYAGAGKEVLERIAWWQDNSDRQTHPVGLKQPNQWGLHDMLGNVFDWCSDGMRRYSSEPAADPVGPAGGDRRVVCGGCWNSPARGMRAAHRTHVLPGHREPVLGFRLTRGQEEPGSEAAE